MKQGYICSVRVAFTGWSFEHKAILAAIVTAAICLWLLHPWQPDSTWPATVSFAYTAMLLVMAVSVAGGMVIRLLLAHSRGC